MRFARAGQCSMVGGEGRSSCRTQFRRFRFMADTPVASELVGAVWPAAHPGEDPLLYGHVELQPKGAFEARSVQTFRLVYTVGRYGIDETGGIAVMFRFFGDPGVLQTSDPTDRKSPRLNSSH